MITKIEIEFPFPIEIPSEVFRVIDEMITTKVCKPYKEKYPDRVMWVSSHGAKPSYSYTDAMFLGKQEWDENIKDGDEPTFNDSIYHIEITERAK